MVPGWNEAVDLKNLLVTAEAVARAALLREESRGAHTRMDFEGESEEWLGYNVVLSCNKKGQMEVQKVKRQDPPQALSQIATSTLEELEGAGV